MSSRRKIRPREGVMYAVPLADSSSYARCVVVRASESGPPLGYFFGPAFDNLDEAAHFPLPTAQGAILIRIFGDAGIEQRRWPELRAVSPWARKHWPVPLFHQFIRIPGEPWPPKVSRVVRYSDDQFISPTERMDVPYEEAESLPIDGMLPHKGIEKVLAEILLGKQRVGHIDPPIFRRTS